MRRFIPIGVGIVLAILAVYVYNQWLPSKLLIIGSFAVLLLVEYILLRLRQPSAIARANTGGVAKGIVWGLLIITVLAVIYALILWFGSGNFA